MSDVIAAPSPAAAEASPLAGTSDAKKSGNVSLAQMANLLAKPAPVTAPEKVTGDAALPAKAGEPTSVAEAIEASRTTETPTQEAAAATQTEPAAVATEAEETAETPTDLSQLSNLDPKTKELVEGLLKKQKEHIQTLIDKRIGKEVAKTKGLEEQLAAMKQQQPIPAIPQNGLLPPPAAPLVQPTTFTPDAPLSNIHDLNTLAAKRMEADTFRQKADDALALGPDDAGRFVIDGEALTKEQVIMVRRNASNIMNVQVPQRAQYIQMRQQAVQAAYEEFPWMKDQQSAEYQQALAIMNSSPAIRALPNAELVIGYHLEGQKAVLARKKPAATATAPVTKSKPPSDQSALGGGSTVSGRISEQAKGRQNLSDEIGKLGSKGGVSVRDTAAFLARKDQLSQSR